MKMLSPGFSPQLKHHKTKKNVSTYSIKNTQKYFVEYDLKGIWSPKNQRSVFTFGGEGEGRKVMKAFHEKHPFEMEKKGLLKRLANKL